METSHYVVALLVSCAAGPLLAQTPDSLRSETGVPDGAGKRTGHRFVKAYRQFIRAQVEETTLIKLGGHPTFGYGGYIGPAYGAITELAVEQKLTPAFSVLVALRPGFARFGQIRELTLRSELAGRWYYAMNRRIRRGKSANNFSDQYLTLRSSKGLLTHTRNQAAAETLTTWGGNHILSIGYGAQRRLGRFGYIDWNVGPGLVTNRVNPYSSRLTIGASLALGFGL